MTFGVKTMEIKKTNRTGFIVHFDRNIRRITQLGDKYPEYMLCLTNYAKAKTDAVITGDFVRMQSTDDELVNAMLEEDKILIDKETKAYIEKVENMAKNREKKRTEEAKKRE